MMLASIVFLILFLIKKFFRKWISVAHLFGQTSEVKGFKYNENLPSYTASLK